MDKALVVQWYNSLSRLSRVGLTYLFIAEQAAGHALVIPTVKTLRLHVYLNELGLSLELYDSGTPKESFACVLNYERW